jgi:hypothetical protein
VDLFDNAWKAHPYNYVVTPNTMLEFEFRSTAEGEIQGIGFDNDNNISTGFSFQLTGTQNWGIQNFNNYSGTSWVTYTIPVGSFFTGSFDKLTFINDNDAGSGNNARFRNVKVFESVDCDPGIQSLNTIGEIVIAGENSDETTEMEIYPNPARTSVRLAIEGLSDDNALVRFTDITGKTMRIERLINPNQEFDISDLAPGVYIVSVEWNGNFRTTEKLVIAR